MTTSVRPLHRGVVFVGGPIQYALRVNQGFDPKLKDLICFLLAELESSGYEVLSAHKAEQFGDVDVSDQTKLIVRRDYEWMLRCDVYVCLLPIELEDKPYRSDGTCIELGWASALKKPILILLSSNTNYSHLFNGLGLITSARYLLIEQILVDPLLVKNSLQSLLYESSQRLLKTLNDCVVILRAE